MIYRLDIEKNELENVVCSLNMLNKNFVNGTQELYLDQSAVFHKTFSNSIMPQWHHTIEEFRYYWLFVSGNHRPLEDSPPKGPIIPNTEPENAIWRQLVDDQNAVQMLFMWIFMTDLSHHKFRGEMAPSKPMLEYWKMDHKKESLVKS